jgi:hypothetical protein
MISAVDTSVLIDVLANDTRYAGASANALRGAQAHGRLVVCEIVLAEVSRYFSSVSQLRHILGELEIVSEPLGDEVCLVAGHAFLRYRQRTKGRERILADFLIGAHAQIKCAQLISRDRGFYRDYFPDLKVIDPAS